VDSNDQERIEEAAEELHRLLADEELKTASVLILANKQDLPSSLSVSQVCEKLGMNELKGRNWHVQPCVALQGEGVYEGLDWVARAVKKAK